MAERYALFCGLLIFNYHGSNLLVYFNSFLINWQHSNRLLHIHCTQVAVSS
jgi:hypothetical protein